MTNRISRIGAVALCALAITGLAAFTGAKENVKTITVVNKTSFNVDRIFLSPVEEKTWGEDILGESEILEPGDQVDIEIECGEWDVKLVADDESTCEVSALDICAVDIWEITADCGE